MTVETVVTTSLRHVSFPVYAMDDHRRRWINIDSPTVNWIMVWTTAPSITGVGSLAVGGVGMVSLTSTRFWNDES